MCYFDLFTPWPSSFDLQWSVGRVKKGFKDCNHERVDTSLCCFSLCWVQTQTNEWGDRSSLVCPSAESQFLHGCRKRCPPLSLLLYLPTSLSHTHIHTLSYSLHITQTFLPRFFCLAQNNSVKPKPKSH
jgi:hypothetical protein